MGFGLLSSPGETVIVVIDANRQKGSLDALNWALNNVVRPKDTVVVLGILCEFGKKSSCFPFYMGIGISSIWERLEFSGQGEMTPSVLEEEIEKKREEYQHNLRPFYQQCKKNEVKLEVKLAAGFDPKKITVEEAQNFDTRWIVLDSHLKKENPFIHDHVGCNIAAMKGKDLATIRPSRATNAKRLNRMPMNNDGRAASAFQNMSSEDKDLKRLKEKKAVPSTPSSHCSYPLSWRTGFPRTFSHAEVERITDGFSHEINIICEEEGFHIYEGVLLETPVFVKYYAGNDEWCWSELNILARVRHRNILNLLGYCYTDASVFSLYDYPCNGPLRKHLECDELAKNLPWKARWDVAVAMGGCLRYLHEECLDGPIVHLSVSSSSVLFVRGYFAMLADFTSAKRLKDDFPCDVASFEEGSIECPNLEEDERLSLDVHDYGVLLLELVTGKTASDCRTQEECHSLVDWAFPLLENGSLDQVKDPRLVGICDSKEVSLMAHAAYLCLKKNDSGHRLSISQVLAVVQGDRFGFSGWTSSEDHSSHSQSVNNT